MLLRDFFFARGLLEPIRSRSTAWRVELGETLGEYRPDRRAEWRRGVCCAPARERLRRRRVERLVASAGTEESSSNEDVAFLGYAWSGHGRKRTAV